MSHVSQDSRNLVVALRGGVLERGVLGRGVDGSLGQGIIDVRLDVLEGCLGDHRAGGGGLVVGRAELVSSFRRVRITSIC